MFSRLVKIVNDSLPLFIKRTYITRKNREELQEYWRAPYDGKNIPSEYLKDRERSIFLLNLAKRYIEEGQKVLEIGCNVGRNLNELFLSGFYDLSGVEISKNAVEMMRKAYPDMAGKIKIYNGAVESFIEDFKDNSFDLVFTMAVLEHIPTESEFIFSHMARIAKKNLITIEDERGLSWRHFPRNYKKIFEKLGLKQIQEISLRDVRVPGLSSNFVARVFKK
ncbi:MAG: class I SAM-dependent methyltransferase [Candidatus Omnitrophota bacterium]|nr:class I SAM-dependent methyltransferase [Candidatus Omnitrophota bacterium]